MDHHGGKVVMAWGVALWSLATFLTPWAAESSLLALLAMRMLLGIAEGVALPCMNNMIARYLAINPLYMISHTLVSILMRKFAKLKHKGE